MNESKAEGAFDVAKGKVKRAVGETFNDQSMANSGTADQVKGHAKEAWGSAKDTAGDVTSGSTASRADDHLHNAERDTSNAAHNVRDDIARGAEHVKDSIKSGLHKLEHKIND